MTHRLIQRSTPDVSMKTIKAIAWCALALIAVMTPPRRAVAQDTSVVRDLLNKGKQDLDALQYSAAADIAGQLLKVPSLTKDQRVGAIELLLAAVYPDDPSNQHADSAVALIKQLVDMGVTGGVARDIATPPLDTLFASVTRRVHVAAVPVQAQGEPAPIVRVNVHDNADTVLALVQHGMAADEVLQRVGIDCYSFPFTTLDEGLRRTVQWYQEYFR